MKHLLALLVMAFLLPALPAAAEEAAFKDEEKTRIFDTYSARLKNLRLTSVSLTLQMTSWDILQDFCLPYAETEDQEKNLRAYTDNRAHSESVKALVARIEANENEMRRRLLTEMNEELGVPPEKVPVLVEAMTAMHVEQRAKDVETMRPHLKDIFEKADCDTAFMGPAPFEAPLWFEREKLKNANRNDDPDFSADITGLLQ